MFRLSTVSVAKATCDQLHYNDFILKPKSADSAVGVMAAHYSVSIEPNNQSLSLNDMAAVKERFLEANKNQSSIAESEYNELVQLMSYGIRRMVTTIRSSVVPFINAVVEGTSHIINESAQPNIKLENFVFADIHNDPMLTGHVLESYNDVRQLDAYRTFVIEYPGDDVFIKWISSNGIVSPEATLQWLGTIETYKLRNAWELVFNHDRTIVANHGVFDKTKLPFNVDALLLIYFATIYLTEEPMSVMGESVTLEEWQKAMRILHRYAGALLAYTYQKRAKDIQMQVIVYNYRPETEYGSNSVIVNGELTKQWLEQGGDIKQIFGALVSNTSLKTIPQLEEKRDELIKAWDRKYYILKQIAQDNFSRRARDSIKRSIYQTARNNDFGYALPETLTFDELNRRLECELNAVRPHEFDDLPGLIKCIVCRTIYPNTPYLQYLDSMERAAKSAPELTPREAGLMALVDLVAAWLAGQIQIDHFEPDCSNGGVGHEVVSADEVDNEEREVVEEKPGDVTSLEPEIQPEPVTA